MTANTRSTAIRQGKRYSHDLGGGFVLEGEVSPCVFMDPTYPLQVQVTLRYDGDAVPGVAHAVDRTLTAETATDADVIGLLEAVRTIPCTRCSRMAFDPSTIDTNRGGLCESCFVSDIDAEIASFTMAEKRRLATQDRRMKRNGMTVRVTAWIHPARGGDDYQADWYFATRPTPAQIRSILREEGSRVLNDYRVILLN